MLPNSTGHVRPFSKDRLHMVSRDDAMKSAMGLLDRIQNEEPEVALAGTAIMFAAFVRRLGLSPAETHELGKRILAPEAFHQKSNITGEVLRDFAGIRLAGDAQAETGQ
jgi:hypothetical protein